MGLSAVCAYNLSTAEAVFSRGKYMQSATVEQSHTKWVRYNGAVPTPRPGAVSAAEPLWRWSRQGRGGRWARSSSRAVLPGARPSPHCAPPAEGAALAGTGCFVELTWVVKIGLFRFLLPAQKHTDFLAMTCTPHALTGVTFYFFWK